MTHKLGGKYRFCLDFRKLNTIFKKDAYTPPYMKNILRQLKAERYINNLDLSAAFSQIPLDKASQEQTPFKVPERGLLLFNRMLFGLTGAPATFQRLLDRVLTLKMRPNIFSYLDKIIIVNETFDSTCVG